MSIAIRDLTRHAGKRMAGVPFEKAARSVLPGWDVSLVLVGERRARRFNRTLRKKTYTPNVLSYRVGKDSGEVIICPTVATRQAPAHGLSDETYCLLLFIHALLHLKGWAHGARMEACERLYLSKFARALLRRSSPHGKTHSNRDRHRNLPSQGGRRRRSRR